MERVFDKLASCQVFVLLSWLKYSIQLSSRWLLITQNRHNASHEHLEPDLGIALAQQISINSLSPNPTYQD
jgi:hypothetical protein